jgi:hypothetical protein
LRAFDGDASRPHGLLTWCENRKRAKAMSKMTKAESTEIMSSPEMLMVLVIMSTL